MNNNNKQMNLNIDIKNTTPVISEDGGMVFQEGFILRRVSKFISGTSEDGIIPVPVFFDVKSGRVLIDMLPKELRDEFQEIYDKEDSTK
jgi:hypothetical protein